MMWEGQVCGMGQPGIMGRFAPSPSGRMHLGNALTALLCWLSARSQGGRLLLRVEDLDPERSKPEYTVALMDDLLWLGLDWDEGPRPGDAPGFEYFQSQRGDFYQSQLDQLAAMGLLYPCFCTRAELHAASAPHASDGTPRYDGRCLRLSENKIMEWRKRRRPATRVRVPDEVLAFTDGVQGEVCENLLRQGDFILRRSDGVYAYQLAAPVDDVAAGVTEVVRGVDLLSSTTRQIWLMRTLGYEPPRYFHTPLLLAPDGRRLSKRDRDLDLGALRARLKGPEALLGVLGHLAGLLPEAMPISAADLMAYFSWAKVPKESITMPDGFLADYF